MTKNQKMILEPHAQHFSAMSKFVFDLNDQKLTHLLDACLAATTSNCAWDIYAAAQFIKMEVQQELNRRERLERKKPA